ncbi:MAG: thiol-disulfide oxidoreductase DCC family protein [Prolixibacteraceae bacterium]|nr:thiol-disulfide oxidoreductase DCC family protein [Prolixibacteraceae bacterium]MBN2774873.1 thiol-disulfide oxidoreductase DCC family protein [Prolixibacteraceae bacterium]
MQPVILFDGYCNLCNATVNFIIRHDKKKLFRFAALQSDVVKELLFEFLSNKLFETVKQINAGKVDTVILIYNNEIYIESDAGLKIAGLLGFPWNIPVLFKIVPKGIRDRIYRWIAKNRYKWFGKRKTCRIPATEESNRFFKG